MSLKKYMPPLGNRIIKTAVAVFICLILHMLVGYRGSASSAAITAIICMQPYAVDSRTYAADRILGTLLGSLWGFAYLFLLYTFPMLDDHMSVAYSIMSLFVLLALYSAVFIKKSSAAGLVVIVFLGMVIDYPEVAVTPVQALGTLLDTLVGTLIAIAVNVSHLPRRKHPEKLFFVRTMDLVPDRYTQIPSSVHIALDYLYNDGARICLVSRWAPAFIISQMGFLNVNAPAIVMDGAALYDIKDNKYLDIIDIPRENAERLRTIITGFGSFCSYYTIHDRSLCIYRDGPLSDAEREEYAIMKRSPYRNYMDGPCHEDDKIAFMRVIDTPEKIEKLSFLINSVLPADMFRIELRQEPQFPDYCGLYFYSPEATVTVMKERLTAYMNEKFSCSFQREDILPKLTNYSPEHDALLLLGRLKKSYEPPDLLALFRSRKNTDSRLSVKK